MNLILVRTAVMSDGGYQEFYIEVSRSLLEERGNVDELIARGNMNARTMLGCFNLGVMLCNCPYR